MKLLTNGDGSKRFEADQKGCIFLCLIVLRLFFAVIAHNESSYAATNGSRAGQRDRAARGAELRSFNKLGSLLRDISPKIQQKSSCND